MIPTKTTDLLPAIDTDFSFYSDLLPQERRWPATVAWTVLSIVFCHRQVFGCPKWVSRASRGSGLVLTATKKLEASADLLSTV